MNAQAASCPFVINTLSIHVCGASVQFQATEASALYRNESALQSRFVICIAFFV